MMGAAFYTGLATQASLIVAIGAQNNYVLRQGLRQQHLITVVGFCIVSDIMLAACAIFGLTPIVNTIPFAMELLKALGVVFLFTYAFLSFKRAFSVQTLSVPVPVADSAGHAAVWISLVGFTWLNPHVWMDTLFLLGSVAQTQTADAKIPFMAGVSLISIVWFSALGYGARILKPLFAIPKAWQVLDFTTGTLMIFLAATLLLNH